MDESTNKDDDDLMFDGEDEGHEDSQVESNTESNELDEDFDFDIEDSEIEPSEHGHSQVEHADSAEHSLEESVHDESMHDQAHTEIEEEASTSSEVVAAGHSAPVALEDIPLPIVIELGRVQMSIKKLLELQPGNMLELNIHPETGVDLTVNGKRVARGELLRIGEALGVRILELS